MGARIVTARGCPCGMSGVAGERLSRCAWQLARAAALTGEFRTALQVWRCRRRGRTWPAKWSDRGPLWTDYGRSRALRRFALKLLVCLYKLVSADTQSADFFGHKASGRAQALGFIVLVTLSNVRSPGSIASGARGASHSPLHSLLRGSSGERTSARARTEQRSGCWAASLSKAEQKQQ